MKYALNESIQATVISVGVSEVSYRANFYINNNYHLIVTVMGEGELIGFCEYAQLDHIALQTSDGCFVSLFDITRQKKTYCITQNNRISKCIMLAKKSIFGPTVVRAKDCFQKLRLEITDGYELIGLYPYKNDRKANMFLEDINICPEYASISLNTSLGELSCFKVTDFERTVIQDTFDFWFGHYDRLGVVGDAYHRLLLSHDNGDLQTGS